MQVPVAAPVLENNQPHSLEHGSIELELNAHVSHTHALYQDDNLTVYHYLEEATHSTSYAASIKPFQHGKDGHGAWAFHDVRGQFTSVRDAKDPGSRSNQR